jgi:hypothetical protein
MGRSDPHRRAAPRCAYHENRMSNIDNLSIRLYTLGRELGEIAQRTRDQGITLGYHDHHWELAPKDGAKTARASYAFISRIGV